MTVKVTGAFEVCGPTALCASGMEAARPKPLAGSVHDSPACHALSAEALPACAKPKLRFGEGRA
jgi:hypothetical protein